MVVGGVVVVIGRCRKGRVQVPRARLVPVCVLNSKSPTVKLTKLLPEPLPAPSDRHVSAQ
ncbi:hypothetical protein SCLCIDRAFT_1219176 [Scleroderma citrinum Foug A]|uniref:Uncharacterized protein n=1 Tax=Scleroderma citrinum Foug A TaxID=1036808 RepID=A0A0C2Z6T0_9AGAM|nr:hypothetical protein SCLCIDRAFT_1219176 [Scleroderma citrinum Foug A]